MLGIVIASWGMAQWTRIWCIAIKYLWGKRQSVYALTLTEIFIKMSHHITFDDTSWQSNNLDSVRLSFFLTVLRYCFLNKSVRITTWFSLLHRSSLKHDRRKDALKGLMVAPKSFVSKHIWRINGQLSISSLAHRYQMTETPLFHTCALPASVWVTKYFAWH